MLSEQPFIGFVPVSSTETAEKFYVHVLGLTVLEQSPYSLVVKSMSTMIRLTPVPELQAQPFTIAGWQVHDIENCVKTLLERGVSFERYEGIDQDALGVWTAPNGDRVAWFKDLDGNTLSLSEFAS
jgi:hypothetical protein